MSSAASPTTPKPFSPPPPPPSSSGRSAPPSRKVSTAAKTPRSASSPQNEQPPPSSFPPPHVFDILPPLYDILLHFVSTSGTHQPGGSMPGGGSISSPLLKAPVPVHPQGLNHSLLASPSLSTATPPAAARSVAGGGDGVAAGTAPANSLNASGLGLGASASTSAPTPMNSGVDPKQLVVSASAVKVRIQKARNALENLPDMSRTVEQQEEEMRALEEKIRKLKGIFGDFAQRSANVLDAEKPTTQ